MRQHAEHLREGTLIRLMASNVPDLF